MENRSPDKTMKYLIKLATRGRRIAFLRAIENIQQTFVGENYEILVSGDFDDPEMNNPDIIKFCKATKNITLVLWRSTSKVEAINRDMEYAHPWDVLINFSDDMSFQVKGWNEVMERRHKEVWGDSLDFFAHWNDGYVGEGLATMSVMGKTYWERDHYIYFPGYKSFSCDAEAMYVAQMRQRWHYFHEVLFLHQHPANAKGVPNDETYRINSQASSHDETLYWERLHRYFDEPHDETTPIPFKQHFKR